MIKNKIENNDPKSKFKQQEESIKKKKKKENNHYDEFWGENLKVESTPPPLPKEKIRVNLEFINNN